MKGSHRYCSFAPGRDPKVLEQSVAGVVEAAFKRRGTVSAPQLGATSLGTLVKVEGDSLGAVEEAELAD